MGSQPRSTSRSPNRSFLGLLGLFAFVSIALAACAEATRTSKEPAPLACQDGYSVGADGECAVPSITPGDVQAPGGAFVPPTLDNSDVDHQAGYFLTQEGSGHYQIYTGESVPVGVRAITYVGRAAPAYSVHFKPIGDLYDTTMSAGSAVTNEFGVAQIAITGGTRPTHFSLQITAEDAVAIMYEIDVVQPPLGGDVAPPDPGADGGDGQPNPPAGGLPHGNCGLETRGTYSIHNHYEPAQMLGDGPFRALDQIHQALSDPGGFVADLIAQRIDGVWGDVIRGAIGPVVDYLFNYILNNYAPDWVQWMLIIADDVTGILTDLEIEGTMELGPLDRNACTVHGTHKWDTLVFIWRAGCAAGDNQCGRFPIPLQQLGVALSQSDFDAIVDQNLGPVGHMQIGQHAMNLNLGVAVLWFIENVILPQRLQVNSFGELLGLVIPCDAVGSLAAEYLGDIPFVGFAIDGFVQDACESGLEAAGNALTSMLADALNVSTFTMAGECKIRDTNGDVTVDKLEEGRWTQGLQGDFTGERR